MVLAVDLGTGHRKFRTMGIFIYGKRGLWIWYAFIGCRVTNLRSGAFFFFSEERERKKKGEGLIEGYRVTGKPAARNESANLGLVPSLLEHTRLTMRKTRECSAILSQLKYPQSYPAGFSLLSLQSPEAAFACCKFDSLSLIQI